MNPATSACEQLDDWNATHFDEEVRCPQAQVVPLKGAAELRFTRGCPATKASRIPT